LDSCSLEGDDFAFVYHLEGLEKLELNESECEVLPANKPAWGDLLRRMPALRVKVQILEDLIDDAILSSIADGILDNSVFEIFGVEKSTWW